MTLLEKAEELGLDVSGGFAAGCPHTHGLTTKKEDRAYCGDCGGSCGPGCPKWAINSS